MYQDDEMASFQRDAKQWGHRRHSSAEFLGFKHHTLIPALKLQGFKPKQHRVG